MTTIDLLTVIYGTVIGISLGLTGGGGSIFAVPLLIYGLHSGVREAVGISLAAVGATALFGALMQLRPGQMEAKTAILFALAGTAGAPLGTWLGARVSDVVILTGFAAMMLAIGIRMWRQKSDSPVSAASGNRRNLCERKDDGSLIPGTRCIIALVTSGFLVGVLSGLFGVGGGFLIVPVLVLVSGMDIHRAVASSLLVISLICVSGVVSFIWQGGTIPPLLSLLFIGGGLLGMFTGSRLRKQFSPQTLRRIFAASMWGVGLFILTQNAMTAEGEKADPVVLKKEEIPDYVRDTGKSAASALGMSLKTMLSATMKEFGPVEAIKVCNHAAGPAAEAVTKQFKGGAEVRRTALRVRNPSNAPDKIDTFILHQFEKNFESGQDLPEQLVTRLEDGTYRHYQPLITQKVCLTCHGGKEAMSDPLRTALAELYPDDKATGFQPGSLRGVIRVDIKSKPDN
ncbi:MAG: TSUP family transporter [Verrucomicrobiales bacterium]|nr:TSUP family transporter [Verrucomicrobiales bacterium]